MNLLKLRLSLYTDESMQAKDVRGACQKLLFYSNEVL